MVRVDYDDGVVVWRRGLVAKVGWAAGIAAYTVAVLLVEGIDRNDRAFFLFLAALGVGTLWARVWRPHLAASPDGLIVRQATRAFLVPWANISGVSKPTIHGMTIWVRVGSHVSSAVPAKGPIEMLLNLDSEADRAAEFIEERARLADLSGRDDGSSTAGLQ